MKRKGHITKTIVINDEDVDIDKRITELIRVLNKFGLNTRHSCQGDEHSLAKDSPIEYYDRYVSFDIHNITHVGIHDGQLDIHWNETNAIEDHPEMYIEIGNRQVGLMINRK